MRVKVAKSKNTENYYVIKSVRQGEKTTSKVVARLGNREEIREKIGKDADVMEWAKEQAARLTRQEKERTRKVARSYDPTKLVSDKRREFLGGNVFIERIMRELGVPKLCRSIAGKTKITYDLWPIVSALAAARVLEPGSKASACELAGALVEQPAIERHHVYRALDVLSGSCDLILSELYKASEKLTRRKKKVLYFDCTNFFFEIEKEDDFRKYGPSKERRPNPIVEMGMFMDADGVPLTFCMAPGNKSEQLLMTPLEQKIIDDFGIDKLCVCTDAGLSSMANRRFNSQGGRHFVTATSIKKMKQDLKGWALDRAGWSVAGSKKTFRIDDVEEKVEAGSLDGKIKDMTFYKVKPVREKDKDTGEWFDQTVVVTFSFKHRDYQKSIRDAQIERARRAIAKDASRMERKGANDFRRLVKRTAVTAEGEVAKTQVYAIDEDAIAEEERYDGFYALATSFEDLDVSDLLRVNAQRWQIEECFRIMKTEFAARPVYLSREERIRAHFLTCFIALLVYRIIEKKLGDRYTCCEIIDTLRSMRFEKIEGEGWAPLYARTEITDALHAAFGFRTDYEIVPNADMRRIYRHGKNR